MQLPELKDLGLSSGQIQVYEVLLEFGSAGIQKIQEGTGLERRAIYDILNKLIEKGLVSYTQEHNKRSYQCTHPSAVREALDQKKESLDALQEKLPTMIDLFDSSKLPIGAQVFRGNQALKALLNEMLEHQATYWIGGNSGVETHAGKGMSLWFKQWTKRRIAKKKVMYDLVDVGTSLEDFPPQDKKKHKAGYYHYCQLPKKMQSPMVIIIFGNKVAQVLWSKQSFAFVLESEEIRESFMKYFHYFWKGDPIK